jgi:energy-coupling factor transporter ATP-binding protein EcfA2
MTTMVTGAESGALLVALEGLDRQVAGLRLPVEAPDAQRGRALQREIADQLGDYVLPRLRRLDAPLLAVVGGPTGAGKSTLVNSLVGVRVSPAGVLRPTTRSAVLAHNPADGTWFDDPRILPGLRRVGATTDTDDPTALRLAPSDRIPAGLAVLDAPDIDSVVTRNRELATQLLAAADMWVFVTTAARYADAVPWEFLRAAVTRGTAVAIVLDRVPPDAVEEVRSHLASMLTDQGLGGAPLFVVAETATFDALLPDESVEPIRSWLHGLASDASLRAAVVRHTLDGAVRSLGARVFELAAAADAQAETVTRLGRVVDTAYDAAVADVDEASSDGSLLRGEVLARWQEFVGTGELMRSLEEKVGRVRDRVSAAVQGKPAPGAELVEALETGVEALVRSAADEAADQVATAWAADPAGRVLLGDDPSLRRASADLPERTARAVRDWQGYVIELVRSQGQGKRRTARYLAFGVNGLGLMVMIVVFAHTGGLVAGEIAVAGGASALSQKILEAVMGDQAVRTLAEAARADLHRRVEELLVDERRRFAERLAEVAVDESAGARLRAAVQDVEEVR